MRRLPATISEELDINFASYESCVHAYLGLNIVLLKSGDEYLDSCFTCDDHLGSAVMCDIAIDTHLIVFNLCTSYWRTAVAAKIYLVLNIIQYCLP
ncbi:hypothetical protein R3W88_027386 [Solanum pinnatisectum]|uniref:Uncharacterized protein n=1 Tax=Solanum pinnatisectum TaxID=50273 RepID=A0AAV9LH39_9SOLN|nr:hypothetical protein R3W88_027386 [Solanum pinnatisectum]